MSDREYPPPFSDEILRAVADFTFVVKRDWGVWTAHALDVDVVSQGKTAVDALAMVTESAKITVEADISAGKNWNERRAPPYLWPGQND